MSKIFHLVLHTHMPYVLESEVEYWLFEVVLHSYLPILQLLEKLESLNFCITINLSPILLVQLDSPIFLPKFEKYLECRKKILSIDSFNQEKKDVLQKDLQKIEDLEHIFYKWDKNIISAFQYYKTINKLNIITSSATHALLPTLVNFPSLLDLQISIGKKISEYFFEDISGFWIPECAVFEELSPYLKQNNITYSFVDAVSADTSAIHYSRYKHNDVTYLCNNKHITAKIWDAKNGYPGQHNYREFHRELSMENTTVQKILQEYNLPVSGVSLYSITDKTTQNKNIYNHHNAQQQLYKDVDDFITYLLKNYESEEYISVSFDTELFGHWWKEGVDFLCLLIPKLLEHGVQISPETLFSNISEFIPRSSTWGTNNNMESWINNKTQKMWENLLPIYIEFNNKIMNNVYISKSEYHYFLLAQASDWSFLVTHNSFVEFSHHHITYLINAYKQKYIPNEYCHAPFNFA